MAKPLSKISKTEFKDSYNIVEILTSKSEIMEFAKSLKDDNKQAVAFAVRKQHRLTLEDRVSNLESKIIGFDDKLALILQEIKNIKTEIREIKNRLDRNHIY